MTTHKVAIWTASTEDNIDAMVFEATIDQNVLPPEVISNTITYILNLRHLEVELRSIYPDQLETVIYQAQRQSASGISAHPAQLRRQHLPQQRQAIIDRIETWTRILASTFALHLPSNTHHKSVIDDINQDRASSSRWRSPLHQPQVQQSTPAIASVSSSPPIRRDLHNNIGSTT